SMEPMPMTAPKCWFSVMHSPATPASRSSMIRRSLFLLACTTVAPAAAQVRDSAGIKIVTNRFPLPSPVVSWQLSEKPVFDIGGGDPDGPYDLRAFQVVRTANGNLIVANGATFSIRIYDSLGKHLTTAGRRG